LIIGGRVSPITPKRSDVTVPPLFPIGPGPGPGPPDELLDVLPDDDPEQLAGGAWQWPEAVLQNQPP
jgi:hypothetical protein